MSTTSGGAAAPSTGGPSRRTRIAVAAGIVAVALNLRAAITVVGPLIPAIRADLDVSNTAVGVIGTIPVLAFGPISGVSPALGRRFGIGRSLAGALVLLTVAVLVRSAGGYGPLVLGTALVGVAIAVCNVLLPVLAKAVFPERAGGIVTGYTALFVLAATASATLGIPLERAFGWRVSAGVWAGLAAVGAVVVVVSLMVEKRGVADEAPPEPAQPGMPVRTMLRDATAWWVTAFMGLQSTAFYVSLAWLPDIWLSNGLSEGQVTTLVGVWNLAGLVGVLVIPPLHAGRPDQLRSTVVSSATTVAGTALLLVPGFGAAVVGAVLLGLGLGSAVALALSFFAYRTLTPADASTLSGTAQGIGYLISAAGPVLWGVMRDATGSWTTPTLVLLATAMAVTVTGIAAARDRTITAP